mgnify:CR=1 FL=1
MKSLVAFHKFNVSVVVKRRARKRNFSCARDVKELTSVIRYVKGHVGRSINLSVVRFRIPTKRKLLVIGFEDGWEGLILCRISIVNEENVLLIYYISWRII